MPQMPEKSQGKRILTALLAGLVLVGFFVYVDYRTFLVTPMRVPRQGLTFVVQPGDSIGIIARRLRQQGVLRSSWYLQAYARLSGIATRLQAGEYAISPMASPLGFIEQLVKGRVIQYPLTIVEGWTFRQMLEAIARQDKIRHSLQGLDDGKIMARLGRPGEHPEGRFFPDTYFFSAGTSDLALLRRAYAALQRRLQEAWERRAPDLPLTSPYQALILASVVEKETGLPDERREIAGVFIRRLQRGLLLQADPTVIYGLGRDYDGDIRSRDLLADNPYNTYVRLGLPPTPIALPSADSIAAAVDPAPGNTLYFVANGEGGHVFSRTLEEHHQAVIKYQINKR